MTRSNNRALLALVLLAVVSLGCIQSASATASCTPMGGGTAQNYNNCTQICCASGVVTANNNDLSSCCHDAGTSFCPLGYKCCTPTPAITVAANQRARACYAEDLQGCCSFQREPTYDSSFTATLSYDAATFFKDEAQCCTARGSGYFDQGTGSPVVPKWVNSCVKHLADNGKFFKCFADGDCPESTKCCRRPQQASETSTGQYNANSPGTCYDPAYTSCCAGGTGVKYGSSTQYNQTFLEAQLYDPFTSACCAFPRNDGGLSLIADISGGERCPCLQNTDCPSTNFTCCAPTEAELQRAGSSYKRMIKCDTGCPTSGAPAGGGAYFQGCYGSCIASSTAGKTTDEVCLTGSALSNRCDNVRFLTGTTFSVPTASQLIVSEANLHWMDCCPSGSDSKAFNVLYSTQTDFCCPVVGSRKSGGTRFLSPTVQIQSTYDTSTNQQACLCSADADCPNGQTCCAGANHLLSSGAASLNYGNYTGLCYDSKVRSCCAYKAGLGYAVSKVYDPSTEQCCATGPQSTGTACGCHTDAECPGTTTACCTGAVRYGNGTHGVGTCYDTRYQSCCQTYAIDTNLGYPVEDSRITAVPTIGRVYNNLTSVCCKWNGIQTSLRDCICRADRDDCPNGGGCCASNGTAAAFQSQGRYQLGRCFNPKSQGCCVNKWLARSEYPEVYNKEKEVCCPNNGVQPDHRSCKCGSNAECPANGECCLDAQAREEAPRTLECPTAAAPCLGRCVHTAIETCCDNPFVSEFAADGHVKACAAESQKCCNGQCCTKAYETCKKTNVNKFKLDKSDWSAFEGAEAVGYHYGLDKETTQCTVREHSSPSIIFHTWVFPTFLSIAALAFIAAGVKTALGSDISPNMVKLGLVGISVLVGLMSVLLLWSPLWKYGFVIVVANTIILSVFSVGGVWPKRFAVAVAVVCFLWVVEPFGSNSILNFGTTTYAGNQQSDKPGANGKWYNAHGLNYAARLLQRERDSTDGYDACTAFYQYWMVDGELKDQRVWNPAGATRGICRRSWMHTITVMAGLITPFQTIFLLLAGLALARASNY